MSREVTPTTPTGTSQSGISPTATAPPGATPARSGSVRTDERAPRPLADGAKPVIELRGVRKVYGSGENVVEALKGVDFAVHPDRLTAIVGPSGSGKSTLLNLLGALDVPSSGQVLFDGRDLATFSESERTRFRARNIGFVFQFLNLLPGLTCEQNVMLGGVLVGMDPADARRRAGELLEIVGLGDKRKRPARKLSGGQMQRVAIARALINDPPLLLADEPTGNLDEENAEEITALLRERAVDGRAVVLVTHNGDLAEQYADDVMVVRSGHIEPQGRGQLHEIPGTPSAPVATPATPPPSPAQPAASVPSAATSPPAAPQPSDAGQLKIEVDPNASADQLIVDVAMALARQGTGVRLRRADDGRVEIEADRG